MTAVGCRTEREQVSKERRQIAAQALGGKERRDGWNTWCGGGDGGKERTKGDALELAGLLSTWRHVGFRGGANNLRQLDKLNLTGSRTRSVRDIRARRKI
jgi:hypothetical protein